MKHNREERKQDDESRLTIKFYTLGCKVNQYETQAMKESFQEDEFLIVDEKAVADICVVNTCTVTNMADRKARQMIRRIKRENEDCLIVVTGCYAQVEPDEVAGVDGVDIVVGNREKRDLKDIVKAHMRMRTDEITSEDSEYYRMDNQVCPGSIFVSPRQDMTEYRSNGVVNSMDSRTRAYIKIEEGCDRFCSYCIIPYARGKVRSRELEEIINEAKGLIDAGFKELVLTGINTALYGKDMGSFGLEELLTRLDELDGDFRIRLSSLEPTVVDVSDTMKLFKFKRLCRHLHLSIQSGSDTVLKRMNRHYTAGEYLEIVKAIKNFDTHYGISTDIIVGFPEETDDEFLDTMRMVKEAGYVKVHAFKYSQRRGTRAANMRGQILPKVKAKRAELLAEISNKVANEFMYSCIGDIRSVLFEEKVDKNIISGYTDNYIKVFVEADVSNLNKLVDVKLIDIYEDGMKGEIVNG